MQSALLIVDMQNDFVLEGAVYLETSIVSYLTVAGSRDLVHAELPKD